VRKRREINEEKSGADTERRGERGNSIELRTRGGERCWNEEVRTTKNEEDLRDDN
jgi:hypothetical protein